ncbi:hypothetical protein DN752_23140 [Echinicola strongylocentroti]|uniref:Lipoprotein n=1 Tax=Echinicola strongylocentroti TaxID=1795355 RepID=A0A2Z4IPT4_9BACT|nr:hypothetical protein [Echinicola strongylocentroti]AWW32804.1 hypothetical protein DN752_23140 [Echinicola strongylocentroti]
MKRSPLPSIIIVLILAVFTSCVSKLDTGNINMENWKNDRNGCKGLRIKDLDELQSLKNTFLEATNQELIVTFGRPDRVELLSKSQSFFFYFLEPSSECDNHNNKKEPLKALFRLNAINKVSEVTITTLNP